MLRFDSTWFPASSAWGLFFAYQNGAAVSGWAVRKSSLSEIQFFLSSIDILYKAVIFFIRGSVIYGYIFAILRLMCSFINVR